MMIPAWCSRRLEVISSKLEGSPAYLLGLFLFLFRLNNISTLLNFWGLILCCIWLSLGLCLICLFLIALILLFLLFIVMILAFLSVLRISRLLVVLILVWPWLIFFILMILLLWAVLAPLSFLITVRLMSFLFFLIWFWNLLQILLISRFRRHSDNHLHLYCCIWTCLLQTFIILSLQECICSRVRIAVNWAWHLQVLCRLLLLILVRLCLCSLISSALRNKFSESLGSFLLSNGKSVHLRLLHLRILHLHHESLVLIISLTIWRLKCLASKYLLVQVHLLELLSQQHFLVVHSAKLAHLIHLKTSHHLQRWIVIHVMVIVRLLILLLKLIILLLELLLFSRIIVAIVIVVLICSLVILLIVLLVALMMTSTRFFLESFLCILLILVLIIICIIVNSCVLFLSQKLSVESFLLFINLIIIIISFPVFELPHQLIVVLVVIYLLGIQILELVLIFLPWNIQSFIVIAASELIKPFFVEVIPIRIIVIYRSVWKDLCLINFLSC